MSILTIREDSLGKFAVFIVTPKDFAPTRPDPMTFLAWRASLISDQQGRAICLQEVWKRLGLVFEVGPAA
jgi:hypothetical protein